MVDADAKVMDLIFGRWQSQILYTGVKAFASSCVIFASPSVYLQLLL